MTREVMAAAAANTVRILLATIGAYALAVATGAACARLLPLPRVEAAMVGTLLSVPVTAAGAVCAFAVGSLRAAVAGILGPIFVLGVLAWFAGPPA